MNKIRGLWPTSRSVLRFGLHTFNFACLYHLCSHYVVAISTMSGASMLPTLGTQGELVLEDKLSIHLDPTAFNRGDLVVLKSPIDPSRLICKRVLGLPGDTVCVDPTGQYADSREHVLIPKGHLWIGGDNTEYSRDSRMYGPVSMGLVQSFLFARVWPLNKSIIFRNPFREL